MKGLLLAVLVLGGSPGAVGEEPVHPGVEARPKQIDTARSRVGEKGRVRGRLSPGVELPKVSQLHSWVVELRDSAGRPLIGADVAFDGGMPEHDHGFPTKPRVTRELGEGKYRVDGVKFSMPGWWEFVFEVRAGGVQDTLRFNVMVEP